MIFELIKCIKIYIIFIKRYIIENQKINVSEIVGAVTYECMSCGTLVTAEELSYLPEIKCICGFRVFRKIRQPIVKQLKAI
jgi:DNA-directed RNA polymerase subunit P